MTASVTRLPVTRPQPAPPGSAAIAAGILAAGRGPEEIPSLVEGFRHAAELAQEITTAMTAFQAAPAHVPFPEMTPAELAEFRAAVALLRAERILRESAAAGSAMILAAVPS